MKFNDGWILPESHTKKYLKECGRAAHLNSVFETFRKLPLINLVIENCNCDSGTRYYSFIKEYYPSLLTYWEKFITSERYGDADLCEYEGREKIAPTTLRYVKSLADLLFHFDTLFNVFDIVEIGGGYGGLCKIINDVCFINKYIMFDLPETCRLQKKFLSRFKLKAEYHHNFDIDFKHNEIDLVIAACSWAELNDNLRKQYIEKVFMKAKRGYIVLNFKDKSQEIKDSLKGKDILTRGTFNFDKNDETILMWGHNK